MWHRPPRFMSFPGGWPRPKHTAGCSQSNCWNHLKSCRFQSIELFPPPLPLCVCLMITLYSQQQSVSAFMTSQQSPIILGTPLRLGHPPFTAGHRLRAQMSCQMWKGQDSNPRAPLWSPIKESSSPLWNIWGETLPWPISRLTSSWGGDRQKREERRGCLYPRRLADDICVSAWVCWLRL